MSLVEKALKKLQDARREAGTGRPGFSWREQAVRLQARAGRIPCRSVHPHAEPGRTCYTTREPLRRMRILAKPARVRPHLLRDVANC